MTRLSKTKVSKLVWLKVIIIRPMLEIFILGQTTNESCLKDLTLDSLAVWSWVQTFIESEEPRDGIKATDSSLDQHSRHIIKILLLIKQWVCQTKDCFVHWSMRPKINIKPNQRLPNFMCHDSCLIVHALSWEIKEMNIRKRAILDQQVPLMQVSEMNICLTKRTGLNGFISNAILILKINQRVTDCVEIKLMLR